MGFLVFQLPVQFEKATSTAMSCSNIAIDSLGLPIPYEAISKRKETSNYS
jgi:hypothetical protein